MRKLFLLSITIVLSIISVKAQTQKGNVLVGGDISHLNLDLQSGNTIFAITIDPKMGWFIHDNKLVGAQFTFGIATQKGATTINYGIGVFGRSYFGSATTDLVRKTKWFLEANVGVFGQNTSGTNIPHTSTNGLGVGIGPGLSYFITSNVALEALAKYNLTVGFGNSTTDNAITASLGFQIYIPGKKLRTLATPK
ncbi:hypothetical protein [Ferruginibacter albus]|uniref:hypothetical protein n=1 Tax=Ferruginibacter albus TaxID=2875540 RepID=UPI001CC605D2|nr:hypothetical protein [Ferruginibacter albus]UAY53085.1 hypothetical protein K9M53_05250 [Ferruginibacter albus]